MLSDDGHGPRGAFTHRYPSRYRQLSTADMLEYLERRIDQLREFLDSFDLPRRQEIVTAARIITSSLAAGGKLLIAGNGGSAAEAQHMAAEFVGRFQRERAGMAAIALTTDTSVLTAVSNDYAYSEVVARQLYALGRPGDVFLGISTSGKSPNLVRAASAAKQIGITTIALLGTPQSPLGEEANLVLCIPAPDAATAQEGHLVAIHIVCGLVEAALEQHVPDSVHYPAESVGGRA